jgi:mRNA interferase RelE/StbE
LAYHVDFSDAANRELRDLSRAGQEAIARVLEGLAANPRRPGVRRVRAVQHLYRARAGDYRIIFAIHEARVIVHVVRVAHRSKAYRRVEALPPGWD